MKFWTLALCALLCLNSCKQKKENETSSETDAIPFSETETTENGEGGDEKIKDCDDFIDQYEEWSEEYIAFMTKYKDNPVKAVTSPEYSEMMLKASSWSQEWLSISVSCAQNSSYQERVEEIADRMDQKIEELGFN